MHWPFCMTALTREINTLILSVGIYLQVIINGTKHEKL